jgi:hypothetical protein
MSLYIRVSYGAAVSHPILEDNLNQVYPAGIPAGTPEQDFQPFEFSGTRMSPSAYQNAKVTYIKKDDGVWTDQWELIDMTPEEVAAKDQVLLENVNREKGFTLARATEAIISLTAKGDLAGVNAWTAFKTAIENYTPSTLSPLMPPLPTPPFVDITGTWRQGVSSNVYL